MNKSEENTMSLEEAKSLLGNAIKTLAKNAVQNKHILSYIEQLEQYIAFLEAGEEKADEPKAE